MKASTHDLIAKFCLDCGKVTFAVLVIGVIVRKPFILTDFMLGFIFTLLFGMLGAILNEAKANGGMEK